MTLKLAQANTIIDTALVEARKRNLAPISVAVLDAGGNVIAFKRGDGSGIVRFDIAYGKAWGSLGMGFGSRELAVRVTKAPAFFAALATTSQGRMLPSPGGVLILDANKEVIGAVGVTGDTGDNDEACAIAGIESVGLKAAPGMVDG